MPVEIRELIIRATVNQDDAGSAGTGTVNGIAPEPTQDAIEQVMQILRQIKKKR